MTIMWPINALAPRDVAFDIASRSIRAPATISGFSQVVASDAGIWKATLANIRVHGRENVLAFRAIANLLEGQANPILIPLCRGYQPIPEGAVEAGLYDEVPHDDESFFDDDSGYIGQVIRVLAAGHVAARAVSMPISIAYAGTIEPGQHFSIGERLYRVRTVTYETSSTATMTFRPPLREEVTAWTELNFDNPVCRMRLASDQEMDLMLQLRKSSSPTVNLIEDV